MKEKGKVRTLFAHSFQQPFQTHNFSAPFRTLVPVLDDQRNALLLEPVDCGLEVFGIRQGGNPVDWLKIAVLFAKSSGIPAFRGDSP